MDIIFCGTPDFSVPPLADLIASEHRVKAVFTQPDRRKGRGQQMHKTAVKIHAEMHNIPVHQPTALKNNETVELISDLKPDLMVVVAYGLIIPQKILDLPKYGCWNIHASLLPRWRGAAPIHRAILAGDDQTGITIMQMEAGLDTGPMFAKYPTDIRCNDTGQSLHDRLSQMGGEAIVSCINKLEQGTLAAAEPQKHELAIYAHKLHKSESVIDWSQSANQIERQIRAFNPWPGSQTDIQEEKVKIWAAKAINNNVKLNDINNGAVVIADKNTLIIQCGTDQLSITEIQKAGKKRLPIAAFMAAKKAWFTE